MYFLEHEGPYKVDPILHKKNEQLIRLNTKVKMQNKKKTNILNLIDAMKSQDLSEKDNQLKKLQRELK